jgi:hypothetical protein
MQQVEVCAVYDEGCVFAFFLRRHITEARVVCFDDDLLTLLVPHALDHLGKHARVKSFAEDDWLASVANHKFALPLLDKERNSVRVERLNEFRYSLYLSEGNAHHAIKQRVREREREGRRDQRQTQRERERDRQTEKEREIER